MAHAATVEGRKMGVEEKGERTRLRGRHGIYYCPFSPLPSSPFHGRDREDLAGDWYATGNLRNVASGGAEDSAM
jgi:hypothetical protein